MPAIKTIYVIWSDIIFKKDHIEFDIKRLKTILHRVKVKGVLESLNSMKNDYFQRLYGKALFKLSFLDGELIQSNTLSPGWPKILDAIELVTIHYKFNSRKLKTAVVRHVNNLEADYLLELYNELLSRTEYLKFLANLLNIEFRLIPVLEYSNGIVEDSFLFRLRNKNGNILLIWENVNLNRATYVFKFKEEDQNTTLEKIENFICSTDFDHKRSQLTGNSWEAQRKKLELGFCKKLGHEGIIQFKAEIEYLIRYTV